MSQSQELLRLLKDGTWWSCAELMREVPCIVHSRVSDLRNQGHEIVHERTGPGASGSRYRLLSGEVDAAAAAAPFPLSSPVPFDPGASSPPGCSPPEQLELVA